MTAVPLSRLDKNEFPPLLHEESSSLRQGSSLYAKRLKRLKAAVCHLADFSLQMSLSISTGAASAVAFTRSSDFKQGIEVGAGVGLSFYAIQQLYECISQRRETLSSRIVRVAATFGGLVFVYPVVVAFREQVPNVHNRNGTLFP